MNIQSLVAMTKGQQQPLTSFSTSNSQVSEDTETDTVTAPAPATARENAGEEFSTFLTLLTAQIRNQDPLAPLDSTQFVEQLATFTNLELQATGNAELENISALLAQSVYTTLPATEPTIELEPDTESV